MGILYGVCVCVCVLHVGIQMFQHPLLKRLCLLYLIAFAFSSESVDYIHVGQFLCSLFCSIDVFAYSFTNTPLS